MDEAREDKLRELTRKWELKKRFWGELGLECEALRKEMCEVKFGIEPGDRISFRRSGRKGILTGVVVEVDNRYGFLASEIGEEDIEVKVEDVRDMETGRCCCKRGRFGDPCRYEDVELNMIVKEKDFS